MEDGRWQVGWIVTCIFAVIASIVSFWLINKHLMWYTNVQKLEQRYIVRILFMPPIYAVISFASYLFWNNSTPILLIRDCYESTVLTAFFYLLLAYVDPDPDAQRAVFREVGLSREADAALRKRGLPPGKWVFPLSFVKAKPEDGLYFLQIMKWGVLQYCVVRPTTTLAAVILDAVGLYCEDSWSPGWGHVYITVLVSVSVSVAMYCLIQLYVPIAARLAEKKPLLKLFAIKAVVFLTFWQATFLSLLSTFGVVKDTQYMTAEDINIGIGALIETFEMVVFSLLHVKAFSYKPYRPAISNAFGDPDPSTKRTPRLKSLAHALDFRETLAELWVACVYAVHRGRRREIERVARRRGAWGDVFGAESTRGGGGGRKGKFKSRPAPARSAEKAALNPDFGSVRVDVDEEVHVGAERQWLGVGPGAARHVYALGVGCAVRQERSAGLEDQIDGELAERGLLRYSDPEMSGPPLTEFKAKRRSRRESRRESRGVNEEGAALREGEDVGMDVGEQRRTSWWGRVYDRLSRVGPSEDDYLADANGAEAHAVPGLGDGYAYDDPPPPSMIRQFKGREKSRMPEAAGGGENASTSPSRALESHDAPPAVPEKPTDCDSRSSAFFLPSPSSEPSSNAHEHDAVLSRLFMESPTTSFSPFAGSASLSASHAHAGDGAGPTTARGQESRVRSGPAPGVVSIGEEKGRRMTLVVPEEDDHGRPVPDHDEAPVVREKAARGAKMELPKSAETRDGYMVEDMGGKTQRDETRLPPGAKSPSRPNRQDEQRRPSASDERETRRISSSGYAQPSITPAPAQPPFQPAHSSAPNLQFADPRRNQRPPAAFPYPVPTSQPNPTCYPEPPQPPPPQRRRAGSPSPARADPRPRQRPRVNIVLPAPLAPGAPTPGRSAPAGAMSAPAERGGRNYAPSPLSNDFASPLSAPPSTRDRVDRGRGRSSFPFVGSPPLQAQVPASAPSRRQAPPTSMLPAQEPPNPSGPDSRFAHQWLPYPPPAPFAPPHNAPLGRRAAQARRVSAPPAPTLPLAPGHGVSAPRDVRPPRDDVRGPRDERERRRHTDAAERERRFSNSALPSSVVPASSSALGLDIAPWPDARPLAAVPPAGSFAHPHAGARRAAQAERAPRALRHMGQLDGGGAREVRRKPAPAAQVGEFMGRDLGGGPIYGSRGRG